MKRFFSYKHMIAAAALCTAAAGCVKKNEYRSMEPVREVNMSTYDFIKMSNKSGLYDTLLYLLDKTGIAQELKTGKNTFFVPQDFSIAAAMKNLNFTREKREELPNWTIDSVSVGAWDTLLHRYMLEGVWTVDSMRLADGITLTTPYGYEMNGKTLVTTASGVSNSGSTVIQYSDKNNSRVMKNWVTTTTESANLKTANGMVHMLESKHIFGFSSFVALAYPAKLMPFFLTPHTLPGQIEIVYFDRGGEGVAYHDAEIANKGTAKYRFDDGVDIDIATEGKYNIGYTAPTEWLKYTAKVAHTGKYKAYFRVASPNDNNRFRLEVDDQNMTGTVVLNRTGANYQAWNQVASPEFQVTEGEHVLKFYIEVAGFNISKIGLIPQFRVPYNGQPISIPGTLYAVDYDWGGKNVIFFDNTNMNIGSGRGFCRTFEDVDTEPVTTEVPNGYAVSNIAVGEWIKYTVDIKKAGKYDINIRASSNNTTGKFRLELDGKSLLGTVNIAKTAGYPTYGDNIRKDVTLPAGVHELRVYCEAVGYNFHKIVFTAK
ncbi:carbohydrate-binding protein [Chitinophaga lutea]